MSLEERYAMFPGVNPHPRMNAKENTRMENEQKDTVVFRGKEYKVVSELRDLVQQVQAMEDFVAKFLETYGDRELADDMRLRLRQIVGRLENETAIYGGVENVPVPRDRKPQ
jgi:hypothetical protein